MLDNDLAALYGATTGNLNKAVSRNIEKFPEDFMFRLTGEEDEILRSQIVTSSHGGRRYLPFVFTEQGVAMLSSVLRSDIAIQTNIQIMRAFVQVRRLGHSVVDIRRKIDTMERKYDRQFKIVFDAIRQLVEPPKSTKKKIKMGFQPSHKN